MPDAPRKTHNLLSGPETYASAHPSHTSLGGGHRLEGRGCISVAFALSPPKRGLTGNWEERHGSGSAAADRSRSKCYAARGYQQRVPGVARALRMRHHTLVWWQTPSAQSCRRFLCLVDRVRNSPRRCFCRFPCSDTSCWRGCKDWERQTLDRRLVRAASFQLPLSGADTAGAHY